MLARFENKNGRNVLPTGRRRGSALVIAMTAMVAMGLLSGAILALTLMNLKYTTYFENSAVLQQTTASLASSVAESLVRDYRQPFWSSIAEGTSRVDDFVLDRKEFGLLPIRFHYTVTRRSPGSWTLAVRGEYVVPSSGAGNIPAPWAVSADISPRKARAVTWEVPVHAN